MKRSIKCGGRDRVNCEPRSSRTRAVRAGGLLFLLLAGTITLSGCSGSHNIVPEVLPNLSLTGNWQFTMSPPTDGSFVGGLQGAYLSQNSGSLKGAANYSVSLTSFSIPCNTGSATITGTVSGQTVQLSAVAGTQSFTFTGAMSLNGQTITGTYDATAGTAADGSPCGAAQSGLEWSATLIPLLTGSVQGSFQSAGGAAGLNGQQFAVLGTLTQQPNTGGSGSVVSGSLSFLNFYTNTSPYPCFQSASVYGQISGASVSLEIVGSDGSQLGLIGEPTGSLGGTGLNTLTLNPTGQGYTLQAVGPSYMVATTGCPGALGNVTTSGDYGTVCLGFNNTTACQQPVAATPSGLNFSSEFVGGPTSSQTITLTNNSTSILSGVTLTLKNGSGATNFVETDTCGLNGVPSQGQPFTFNPQQICTVKVTFAPVETSFLTATLMIALPSSNTIMTVPITGSASAGTAIAEADATPPLEFRVKNIFEANDHFLSDQSLSLPGLLRKFNPNQLMTKPLMVADLKLADAKRDAETD